MTRIRRILGAILHQSMIAQAVTAAAALATVAFLARGMSTPDYAQYSVVTALWAIGNAVVGTGTGTRIAKMSAEGSTRIKFKASELCIASAAAIVVGAYVGLMRGSTLDAVLSGLCMLAFVLAESSTSFEIGAGRFNRYLVLIGSRALAPMALLGALFIVGGLNFTTAVASVLAANIIALALWPTRWGFSIERAVGISSHSIGAMNMALWIIASADRLVLERIVEPVDLATYALAYGLVDRVYRSLSNAYIARHLGASFQGSALKIRATYFAGTMVLGVLLVPTVSWGSSFLSGGRYVPDLVVSSLVVGAGLFMTWCAPYYLRLMATGTYKTSLILVSSLASINLVGNFLIDGFLGIVGAAYLSMLTYALWFAWLTNRRPGYRMRQRMIGRHVRIPA
ncbi:lipopolysaccharide biosynthesis protein [Arthrobacter sp. ISL-30]|uniref:lipopolysaccharide biosynthesis protein n=1 Tax=Arthrobacter sp. ISL-30 TaxID=2819109 RepID=UPI001BE4FDD9|nr:hypothetical protein [Arthrobacter sp. ISL-30]MBT2515740.1 hypothetical protein [Arthrobacter sp. ISL-30]